MLLNSDRFASPFAGIRFGAYAARALPLCGAAVTFFVPQGDFLRGASAKKVTKESGLTPPMLVLTHGPSTSPSFARQRIDPRSLQAR